MVKYIFDSPLAIRNANKADPQAIGEELAALGGDLESIKPEAIVEIAKNRKSALHKHYQWDVNEAAYQHWLDVSRRIVRALRIVSPEGTNEPPRRAWISVRDESGVAYRTANAVERSLELQLAVLKQAERDLDAFSRRYRDLSDICADVEAARAKIRAKIQGAPAK